MIVVWALAVQETCSINLAENGYTSCTYALLPGRLSGARGLAEIKAVNPLILQVYFARTGFWRGLKGFAQIKAAKCYHRPKHS